MEDYLSNADFVYALTGLVLLILSILGSLTFAAGKVTEAFKWMPKTKTVLVIIFALLVVWFIDHHFMRPNRFQTHSDRFMLHNGDGPLFRLDAGTGHVDIYRAGAWHPVREPNPFEQFDAPPFDPNRSYQIIPEAKPDRQRSASEYLDSK